MRHGAIGVVMVMVMVMGCASVAPRPLTYVSTTPPNGVRVPGARFDDVPADQRVAIQTLHHTVAAIVLAPAFRSQLEAIDAVLAIPGAAPLSGRRLAALYLGTDADHSPLPVCYRFGAGGWSETAATGFTSAVSSCNSDGKTVAAITLRTVTLARARSKQREEMACAINTLAHEWAHTIAASHPEQGHAMVFEDHEHDRQPSAVASYVVGALAQCVYLQREYAAANFDMHQCVEKVGTNAFDTASCTAGWGQQFVAPPERVGCE